jgi:hypothetical protein
LNRFQYQVLAILLIAFLGGLGIFASLNLKYSAFLGKYLFVVLAPIASLIFIGIRTLIPEDWRKQVFVLLSFLMIAVNLDVFFRVLKPAYAEPRLIEGISQPYFCCLSTIDCSKSTSQTFTAPENNLCAVRIMLSCTEKWTQGEAVVTLHEIKPDEKLLYQMQLPLKDLGLASRHYVTFLPIRNSKNREYRFSITLLPGYKNQRIAAWFEKGDVYNGGTMMEDGKVRKGSLCFSAYFFNGDSPYSPWEGTQTTVIPQGQYATVKELQFYYECSPDVRTKIVTHDKIVRFEKALKNIEASSTKRARQ